MTRWKDIMKAYPFEESRLEKWQPPYLVQPKLDGDRCWNETDITNPDNPKSTLITSEGNIFCSVPHINEEIDQCKIDGAVLSAIPLDGELYSHELFLEGTHDLIHSIASRTVNISPRFREMEFHVFDLKLPNFPQAQRLSFLSDIAQCFPVHVKLVPLSVAYSLDDIKRIYDKYIEMKYEGIIIRHFEAPYVDRRSTFMMKFKPKKHDRYTIVGFKEEISIDGIPKSRIGSLLLSSKEGEIFSVGAGLNADQKDYLWGIREGVVGHEAVVFYQHLTSHNIPKGTFDIKIPTLGIN
jgi:hypothetical protein